MDVLGWQLELSRPSWLWGLLILPLVWYAACRSLTGFGATRRAVSLAIRSVVVVSLVLVLAGAGMVPPESEPEVPGAEIEPPAKVREKGPVAAEVARPVRVLLVAAEPQAADALAAALAEANILVERRAPENLPKTPAEWETFALVVLCNVPAAAMPTAQMEVLRDYVREGGGLVAVGGDRAFTPGRYRQTPLEEALPVVSAAVREPERPSRAVVFVIDCSRSMAEGGAIELAKEATCGAVESLGPEDQIGVLAFNESSRWLSPIRRLTDKNRVLGDIRSLKAGGQTDMGPAIDKAYLALREAPARRKHIVLLTDGISHPADFEGLAREIAGSGITMSTVALGKDASRPLLETLARIGNGRFYPRDTPADLSRIFELEAAGATGHGVREGAFHPKVAGPAPFLAGVDLSKVPPLLGYVETVAKPASERILVSQSGDPLLVWWRFGKGTSVAFTSDAQDRWAAEWLSWPGFKPFWVQLARHAMRPVVSTPPAVSAAEPVESRVPPVPRSIPLGYYLLAAAAVVFTLDVAVRRWPSLNSKSEARNPKRIQMTETRNPKRY